MRPLPRSEEDLNKRANAANLKAHNNQLMKDILQERRASNKIIDESMSEAHKLYREAVEMINNAVARMNEADQQVIAECARASAKISKERVFQSSQAIRLHQI